MTRVMPCCQRQASPHVFGGMSTTRTGFDLSTLLCPSEEDHDQAWLREAILSHGTTAKDLWSFLAVWGLSQRCYVPEKKGNLQEIIESSDIARANAYIAADIVLALGSDGISDLLSQVDDCLNRADQNFRDLCKSHDPLALIQCLHEIDDCASVLHMLRITVLRQEERSLPGVDPCRVHEQSERLNRMGDDFVTRRVTEMFTFDDDRLWSVLTGFPEAWWAQVVYEPEERGFRI